MAEHSGGRQSDPGLKWLVFGGVAGLGMLSLLLAFLADSATKGGASASGVMGVIGLGVLALLSVVALGPVGRAIGRRISEGAPRQQNLDHDVEELRLQNDDLRQLLSEMQERVDFAERLLARGTDPLRKDAN